MTEAQRVTIIGAGISGLACAYRLEQLEIPVIVLESSPHVGGVIDTDSQNGFLFESGPQSFQGSEQLLNLVRELGLESELQFADPAAPRFVVRNKQLHKIPMSPPAMLTSSFLSASSRWKLASEPLRRTRPPLEEESIATFVRRKFGNEILEYLVAPFVSGVYAGDPEQLSLKAAFPSLEQWERDYGSVVRGAMKSRPRGETRVAKPSLCSFRQGVATLPRALAAKLGSKLKPSTSALGVRRVTQADSQCLEIESLGQSGNERNISGAVVIATPSYTAAELIRSLSPQLAKSLSAIPYAPVTVVANAYKREQVGHALYGFGFLVPRKENIRTLGTVWNSSLFPGRGPNGTVTMTSFIGGATDLQLIQHSDHEISMIVQQDNAALLGISGQPIAGKVWKYPRALPQYNLRHGHIAEAIREEERALPGVFFAGNYLEGPSLAKCIENGFRTADTVAAHLKSA
jgi:protoporphyrinogen/coproporphyrinogen III oxidase